MQWGRAQPWCERADGAGVSLLIGLYFVAIAGVVGGTVFVLGWLLAWFDHRDDRH